MEGRQMGADEIRVIPLKCANCGARLEVSPDMTQFACGYCGIENIVERRGGTVSLKLVSDAIAKVQIGTDKTAAELAIRRLQEDLANWEAHAERVNGQYVGKIKEKKDLLASTVAVGVSLVFGLLIATLMTFSFGRWGWGVFCLFGVAGAVALTVLVGSWANKMEISIKNQRATEMGSIAKQIDTVKARLARNRAIADN
jgi:hypothetical protein